MNKEKLIKEFEAKRGTFITESGTKIEGLSVVPLVQAVNVLQKLLQAQNQECQKHIDAEGTIAFQLYKRKVKEINQDLLKKSEKKRKRFILKLLNRLEEEIELN